MTRLIFFFCASLLLGCSQAPDIPSLSNNRPEGQGVLLHGELRAHDLRTIFSKINRNGRLDGLKPYLEAPSDTQLEVIAGLVNRRLYREFDSPQGLMAAVGDAVSAKLFTRLERSASATALAPDYRERAEVVLAAASDPTFPALAARDRRWLDPEWVKLLSTMRDRSRADWSTTRPHPDRPATIEETLLADLRKLLAKPDVLTAKISALVDTHAFSALARTSTSLREETGVPTFEGLGYGLAQLLSQPPTAAGKGRANRLDQTLHFLHSLNRSTDGLFTAAAQTLRSESSALTYAAQSMRPLYARVVNENLQQRLSKEGKLFWLGLARTSEEQPGPSFVAFFRAARASIADLIGQERPKNAGDEFLFNLTIDFDAYALTRWAETMAGASSAAWKALPEKDFEKAVWRQAVKDEMQPLDCTEGQSLAATVNAEFKQLGLERLAKEAENAISRGGYGDFLFPFTGGEFATLAEAAQGALETINNARPYADPEPAVKLLANQVLAPDHTGKSLLEHLDSDNLLVSLQDLLSGIGPGGWATAKHWLFGKLALDHLTLDTRNLLIDLFKPKPALAARAGELLDGLPLLAELDSSKDGLPTPFAFYHRLLRESDRHQRAAIAGLLDQAAVAGWLANDGPNARFPALQSVFADGANAARLLHAISYLPAEDRETVTRALGEMFGGQGLRLHVDLLLKLLESHPRGLAAWLRSGISAPELPPSLSVWLQRFVASPDFPILVGYLRDHGGRESALRLVRELKALSVNGELREAFGLLTYLQNDRLKDIGRALKAWQATGELDRALAMAETLLQPLVESNPAS